MLLLYYISKTKSPLSSNNYIDIFVFHIILDISILAYFVCNIYFKFTILILNTNLRKY